jgi:hypothetical protein
MATGAGRALAAVLAALTISGCEPATTRGVPHRLAFPSLSSVGKQPSVAPRTTPSAPHQPSVRAIAKRRLAVIARNMHDRAMSVAVFNTRTGGEFRWGAPRGMWTGSVYKLLALETLLLERQHSGSWLSADELTDITAMMEQSRNKAGYRIYLDAGGSVALAAAARRLGLRHTRLGISDPAFTTMGASDGIGMLRALVSDGPLDGRSRRFIVNLMRNVEADQRWGVGVVADPGTTFANKNGWLRVDDDNGPGENDDERWLVNSVGIVRVAGQQLLISVFTEHNPDRDTGIRLVERLVRLIAPTVVAKG